MDHWFDELSKHVASSGPSRRSVFAGIGAMFAASGTGWAPVFAAVAPHPARKVKTIPSKTESFGPCKVSSKGAHYEHHLVSNASAGGLTAILKKSRIIDPKSGTTLDTTILIDGKQQVQLTGTYTKSARSEKLTLGNAFGFGSAVLTSSDGGRTLRGTVGGKTIVPYVVGSGKKLQFVNGKPKFGKPVPGVNDAIKAVSTQATADYQRCTSSVHAGLERDGEMALGPYRARHNAYLERTQETSCGTPYPNALISGTTLTCAQEMAILKAAAKNGVGLSTATTETFFTGLCEACNNKCSSNFFTVIGDLVGCIADLYDYCASGCGSCSKFVNYSGVQFNCQQGCTAAGNACNPVPCGTGLGTSCNPDQLCAYQGDYETTFGYNTVPGLCCPKSHPQECGSPISSTYWYGYNYCCNAQNPCLYDTRFGSRTDSSNWNALYGYYCCPSPRVCGKRENGVWVGECCTYGQTCCGSTCCSPGQVCAHQAAVHLAVKGNPHHLSTPGGAPVCCADHLVKNGQCCQSGHWCGDQCCGAASVFGCPGGVCPPQPTLCLTGVHCGFVCCENAGCADAKTSTCKKASKCTGKDQECLTYPEMGVTSVCCPKGVTCAAGKCCPAGTKACPHVTSGTIGCWPSSQCAPPLPPPK
jgi:hypothetical protein